MKATGLLPAFMLAGLLSAGSALAEESPPARERPPETLMLRGGGFFQSQINYLARLDSQNGPVGTFVDFENMLGVPNCTTVFRGDGLLRFSDCHAVGGMWYGNKLTGTNTLDLPVQWGDITFPTNAQIDTEVIMNQYKMFYQYSVIHNYEGEIAAQFGVNVLSEKITLTRRTTGESRTFDGTYPIPFFGVYAQYNFISGVPGLSAYSDVQTVYVNYHDTQTAGWMDFLLGLEFRAFKNFAIGAAYNRFVLNASSQKENSTISVNQNWNGLLAYGSLYF